MLRTIVLVCLQCVLPFNSLAQDWQPVSGSWIFGNQAGIFSVVHMPVTLRALSPCTWEQEHPPWLCLSVNRPPWLDLSVNPAQQHKQARVSYNLAAERPSSSSPTKAPLRHTMQAAANQGSPTTGTPCSPFSYQAVPGTPCSRLYVPGVRSQIQSPLSFGEIADLVQQNIAHSQN